jgi:hypothetical protein
MMPSVSTNDQRDPPVNQIQQNHLITLVAATGICTLMELEKLVHPRSRIAGQITRIHEAITNIAGLIGNKLDEDWIMVGVEASNAGMNVINTAVQALEPNEETP